MKYTLLYILGLAIFLTACYKDKGNYDYHPIGEPVISNFDTLYTAVVGDSLIIRPKVVLPSGNTKYQGHWTISVPGQMYAEEYDGQNLEIVFGLGAGRYPAVLAVYDSVYKMKYFYNFVIKATTAFSQGMIVLSDAGSYSAISFIKPSGEVQPNVYTAINQDTLPPGAVQLAMMKNVNYGNLITGYWAAYSTGGVLLDPGTLQRTKKLQQNFYSDPGPLTVTRLDGVTIGVPVAIMNHKMYVGAMETAPFATYYGYFGVPLSGNYELGKPLIGNNPEASGYWLGYETSKQKLVRMDWRNYLDTNYVMRDSAFNPKQLKMTVWHMDKFNDNECYAFCDSAGSVRELRFGLEFMDPGKDPVFHAYAKRKPVIAAQINASTVWAASPVGVFFFTQGDKIFRYNPLNQEVKPLATSFDGKTIGMLKILENGNKLLVGASGSIAYLDISVGHNGDKIKQIDGIPGIPVDVIIRE